MGGTESRAKGARFAPPDHTTTGNYVGITVLVDFYDDVGTMTLQQIDDFCNKTGYNGFGNDGSVHDYFWDNSDHRLNYTNIVVGITGRQR